MPLADPFVLQLLGRITDGKRVITFRKGEKIFLQGSAADAIFLIQSGKVKMTVVSSAGKEAVIRVVAAHSFLGEGALVGQSLRVSTATAMEPAVIFRIEKQVMGRALLEQPAALGEIHCGAARPQYRSRRRSLRSAFQPQ